MIQVSKDLLKMKIIKYFRINGITQIRIYCVTDIRSAVNTEIRKFLHGFSKS